MCGIICLIQYGPINIGSAVECLDKLKSRGPDKQHYQIISNDKAEVFMGFARLAIMDITDAGLQPFTDENGNVCICNGEIYNYKELAKRYDISMNSDCDCEILLPIFNKMGFVNMITTELDAEFASVIYSSNENRIYAARDKYGVRPLYYGYNNSTKTIGFASELKALSPIMEFVEQLKPNYMLTVNMANINSIDNVSQLFEKYSYYDYKNLIATSGLDNVEYIQEQILNYLTAAVEKRLHADRQIGFLLSGGLDSSLIVAIATKLLGPDKIVCFSVGIDGSPDIEAAKKVVEYLGITEHHIIPFTVELGLSNLSNVIQMVETYDITTIRASTPQYIMAKYIKEKTNVRVLLSGEGSDEIHGSYRYFRNASNMKEFHWETIRLLEELYFFDNKRTDRSMAGNGLEVRIPFLDTEYVEFITRIDPRLLMYRDDYIEKKIIRDSFKGYLPDEILYRSKEAFSDAVSNNETNWADAIKKLANDTITDKDLEMNEFVFNKPKTKDALYFRRIFNNIYPNRDHIIPHYWLPRFQNKEILDPSARILECY
jgi:asparagine synthase (glutamine-hydrolysing)